MRHSGEKSPHARKGSSGTEFRVLGLWNVFFRRKSKWKKASAAEKSRKPFCRFSLVFLSFFRPVLAGKDQCVGQGNDEIENGETKRAEKRVKFGAWREKKRNNPNGKHKKKRKEKVQ